LRAVPPLRRWLVAAAAALAGTAVAAGLLLYTAAGPAGDEYLVVATDVPAGAALLPSALRVERLRLGQGGRLAYPVAAEGSLLGRRASHDLAAGQLLQRADLLPAGAAADRRLVLVPVRELPPLAPGERVDLLQVSGGADHLLVQPFALGVEVSSVAPGGLILVVSSRQAAAFVYAALAGRLVVVAAPAGSGPGQEAPVSSFEQALDGAR
jgi:hypothetical protein